ncbi:hypothetical protein JCM11641_007766 [Rhodosporidiobolus odoratus]
MFGSALQGAEMTPAEEQTEEKREEKKEEIKDLLELTELTRSANSDDFSIEDIPDGDKATVIEPPNTRQRFLREAVVRLMKEQKEMRHRVLVASVTNIARRRFKATAGEVELAIESCLYKGNMELLDKGQGDWYGYVALWATGAHPRGPIL